MDDVDRARRPRTLSVKDADNLGRVVAALRHPGTTTAIAAIGTSTTGASQRGRTLTLSLLGVKWTAYR